MQALIVLIIISAVVAIVYYIGILDPKLDIVVNEDGKRVLLWYNKYNNGVITRTYIKLK